jgi:uncharacterized protein
VEERKGDWIALRSGGRFWPLDPRPDEIEINDIAHALGMTCRYAGHGFTFYSVAEHCCLLHDVIEPEFKLAALLHDGEEYAMPDMVRPLKRHFPEYVRAGDHLRAMIFEKYGLPPGLPPRVVEFDDRICADEKAQNLPDIPWNHNPEPLGVKLRYWTPGQAALEFLKRFHQHRPA